MNVTFRQGTEKDSHKIAKLDYIASDGALDHELINGDDMASETANCWQEKREKRACYPVERFDDQIEVVSASW